MASALCLDPANVFVHRSKRENNVSSNRDRINFSEF